MIRAIWNSASGDPHHRVAAVPGSSFFREPVNHLIRLHFARSEETLNEALERLAKLPKLCKPMYITDVVTLPRFCFGRGVYRRFPELCKGLGARFALVGGNTAMEKGLPSLKEGLEGSGMQLLCALPFGGACTLAAMDALTAQIDPMRPDFLVGMGGGKAIDTAKGVAHRLGIPLVSLPTLVSNCAPITALSVVYREDGPFDRFLFYDAPPSLTLIDLNLAADAPARFFRAGMGDTLAKYIESTFSVRGDELGGALDHMVRHRREPVEHLLRPDCEIRPSGADRSGAPRGRAGDGNVRPKRHPFGGTGFADGG